jgi:branched-chain amino acid transport system substrate-binding protein
VLRVVCRDLILKVGDDKQQNERMGPMRHRIILAIAIMLSLTMVSAAADEPIKIGWVGTLSGPAAFAGECSREGVLLAVEDLNNAGY